ncbi:FAD-binding oxidoreductase [Paraburkholderia sp. RL17-373-BIF-A]|uniref:FAD-binding oxidoreductase n=1 Tax=Paraburkholderia sp. RL17-373-BIF-A TaxID=3031629 RepID=UPI0038BCA7D0
MIGRDHPDYDNARRVWNGLVDRRPAAILQAESVDDVRRDIDSAAQCNALLAVRGGGHSIPGLSTCDDGLVLDLSRFNSVVMDEKAGTVDVGGGALLGDLAQALAPRGKVVPAGVISHTGVAGLTLGGGMGRGYQHAQRMFATFRITSIVMMLLGLLMAAMSWLSLRRAIGEPITDALAHFKRIADGDLRAKGSREVAGRNGPFARGTLAHARELD